MKSDEIRFKHIGLSSDGAVIFCELDNGKSYAMPLGALDRAESWDPKAKPKSASIIHDGYAAIVKFNTGTAIDFPADFLLHVCEPTYTWYRGKGRATSGIGGRIREIRESRGLTLDSLAAKCGIAKPNLSRVENDRVTPTLETLQKIATALDTHPAMFVGAKTPDHAWPWTQHQFKQWRNSLIWDAEDSRELPESVCVAEIVAAFVARWPEHKYAFKKLHSIYGLPHNTLPLDPRKWADEQSAVEGASKTAGRRKTELVAARRR
jgi:transcriptional regulator with XRE-family HTH domain